MYLKEALNSIERGQSILSQLLDFSNVLTSTRDSITQQYKYRTSKTLYFPTPFPRRLQDPYA
jgi:hypothetical protein